MKQTLTMRSRGHVATRIESHKHDGPEVLQAVEFTPVDPAENEIQIENKATGINFIGTYVRSDLCLLPSLPSGLGAEAAGIVSKISSGVKHIRAGGRVVHARPALGAYSSVHSTIADKATVPPAAISFEQATASFLKGLAIYYLLRKTYEAEPNEQFLFHAAVSGTGLIACQWAKVLDTKLVDAVRTAQKAQNALKAGVWQVINYREENLAERLKEITGSKKIRVVYDFVGRGTWERSLDCPQRRGLMASFGNSSGAAIGMDLGILNQKGSLYVTRPSLQGYIIARGELVGVSNKLSSLIAGGVIKVDVTEQQKYPLKDAQRAHGILESRVTQGSSLPIP